jgi:hypothetical protein
LSLHKLPSLQVPIVVFQPFGLDGLFPLLPLNRGLFLLIAGEVAVEAFGWRQVIRRDGGWVVDLVGAARSLVAANPLRQSLLRDCFRVLAVELPVLTCGDLLGRCGSSAARPDRHFGRSRPVFAARIPG